MEAFWPAHEELRREALYRVLTQAVDASGEPPDAASRYMPRRPIEDEAALKAALADLDTRTAARHGLGAM